MPWLLEGKKKMRIAGVYWYDVALDFKIQHAVSEPYGLERILAVAEEDGCEVELFIPLEVKERKGAEKSASIDENTLVQKIIAFAPDIVCFSSYTCQFPGAERIASKLKKSNPNIIALAGNRYPSYLRDKMQQPFDFFVVKEGEETFMQLLRVLQKKSTYFSEKESKDFGVFEEINGLVFRREGSSVFTGPRKRITDLDSFPDAKRFPQVLRQVYKGISIPSFSQAPHYAISEYSRGCHGVCGFCDNKQVWHNKLTFRSPERVVDELESLRQMGVDIVYFIDLNFTARPDKVRELCNEMLRRNLDISWYCMSNISTAAGEQELLRLMKSAGCFKIAWGVESTNDASLERMNKRICGKVMTSDQVKAVLWESLEAGILNQGYYIIGFPWENSSSIISDAEQIKYLPLHQLNVGIFTPIPMSDFFTKPLELDPDLEKHDRNHLIFEHPFITSDEVKTLQRKIYHDFYSSKEYSGYVGRSASIDLRFRQAFNDYFEFSGWSVRDGLSVRV
jgi:radical SAM superfamily enzyme YgiQ (UPF0313 family)